MPKFQVFHDESFFGILHADVTGAAAYVNPAWTEITGLSREGALGHGWLDAIHPADGARVLGEWRTAAAARRLLDVSFRIVRPDGSRRYVRMRGRPAPAGFGARSHYVGVLLDMTEQVLAERRLRRNNELLTAVLENIPCGVTVYAADGSLILDNLKFRELLSLPQDAGAEIITDFGTLAVGRVQPAPVYPDTADKWVPTTGFDPAPRVRQEIQPDGRVIEVRDAPMPTGGTVTTYTDVTEHSQIVENLQHAKAAAEQAAAAKAAFLAAMSHEIRTPMNGVIGMTNVLLDTKLTPDQRGLLQVIRQSGESLLVVINDILDYSKIDSGQMELEWLPFQLRNVVENSVRLLGAKAQEKRVPITVSLAADLPYLVHGDANRLQQVLVNLISNAVKFTERGEIRVGVANVPDDAGHSTRHATGDLLTLSVTVEDTGIGIPQDKLGSIFEPFVQADSSTARRFGGTGLGLAIARRLVEAMGGELGIQSEPGVGTTVRFTFLAEVAAPPADSDGYASLDGKRVLLVSGTRADVGVLAQQLTRWGMQCRTCLNSAEALSTIAAAGPFDLVLAASHLVDTRGLEFVRTLRAEGVATPVVLVSRKRQVQALDPELRVRVVSRSASESELYGTLVDAVSVGEAERAQAASNPRFDESVALRTPLRILVAEDNEINRRVALRMLAGFGYEADIAHNGAEVIERVQRCSYDLVLMDIEMPQVDGMAATRFIVEHLGQRRPRVVAMSANVMKEHVDAALAAGADEYMGKPFSPAALRSALENAATKARPAGTAAPAPDASGTRVLSPERMRMHTRGDAEGKFLRGLVATFSDTSVDLLAGLRTAVRAGDAAKARAILHEYSGMCAVLGAEKLMHVTQELNAMVRAQGVDEGELIVTRCETGFREALSALHQFLAGMGAQRDASG